MDIPIPHACETKEGIEAALTSPEGLRDLIIARGEASRSGEEDPRPLKTFVVLGSFYLDAYGHCIRITKGYPKAEQATAPRVMDKEEFAAWHNRILNKPPGAKVLFSFNSTEDWDPSYFPTSKTQCVSCQKTFTLEDCREVECDGGAEDVWFDAFVGKTLKEACAAIEARCDGLWTALRGHVFNKNDSKEQATARQESNEQPSGDEVVQPGDGYTFRVRQFSHGPCHADHKAVQKSREDEEQRQLLEALLQEAAFDDARLESVPFPERLANALAQETDGDPAELAGTAVYFRLTCPVFTPPLTCGILLTPAGLMVDLEGSGVHLKDIPDAERFALPSPDAPELLPIVDEIKTLLAFRKAVVKQRTRAKSANHG